MDKVRVEVLAGLEPIASLSRPRQEELARLCYAEHVSKDLDPFRVQRLCGQSVYLTRGELSLTLETGSRLVLAAGSEQARYPLGKRKPVVREVLALTDVELVRIDDDLVDIMVTWDQLAGFTTTADHEPGPVVAPGHWMPAASGLQTGPFSRLPPGHIELLFGRFERIAVGGGTEVIREGDEGDFYYLVEQGVAEVSRRLDGAAASLAQLGPGDTFGEEALLSGATRNASVTMKSDGVLLRLAKRDFAALLQEPMLSRLEYEEALERVSAGAVWLDVRYASESRYDRLPGAINIPLREIRTAVGVLDRGREYVAYCQGGRRSSAAAFILAQHGYQAHVLKGGLVAASRVEKPG